MKEYLGLWGWQEPTRPWLSLDAEGRVTGSDGCNRLMGEYRIEAGRVRCGMLASTMMYCQGVDTWLSRMDSAEIRGRELVVFDAAGDQIGRLPRSE